uniref:Uncharacterized protein n=1 Tax=Trypanosoma congolense (strain IL3000) TaxID=1068625 RepID=G0UY08_TRYCI|nr:conserved hypothetical protein [Trypanosoma congolense IL3000]
MCLNCTSSGRLLCVMLSDDERTALIRLILRRKVVEEALQEVITRGIAIQNKPQCNVKGPFDVLREKEHNCAQLCESVVSDTSISPMEKFKILSEEVQSARHAGSLTYFDFIALRPLFLPVSFLCKFLYGENSRECQVSRMELALAYISQGAYKGAAKVLRSVCREHCFEAGVVGLLEELEAFVGLAQGKAPRTATSVRHSYLLPLALHHPVSDSSGEWSGVKSLLDECERMDLPHSDMLYCYLSAASAGLSVLGSCSARGHLDQARRDIAAKTRNAKVMDELLPLKEMALQQIKERNILNLKLEGAVRFTQLVISRCERFLRVNECQNFDAVWTFAVAKLRWENACQITTERRFVESLAECSKAQSLSPLLRTIVLADTAAVLKGVSEPLPSYTIDLSYLEIPSRDEDFTSRSLFAVTI